MILRIIFPWVLKDYKSNSLDLSNPASYRDLSKPVRQNDKKLKQIHGSLQLSKQNDNKFMYGSTIIAQAAIVLHYLIRLEPFTSLHIALQEVFDASIELLHLWRLPWSCNLL
jgi:hypothetical protein